MRRVFWVFCSLLIGAGIAYMSIVPVVRFEHGTDKIVHAVTYGAWMAATLMIVRQWIPTLTVMTGAFLIGIGVEFVQPYVGRICDYGDMIANAYGMGVGTAFALVFMRPAEKKILAHFAHEEAAS